MGVPYSYACRFIGRPVIACCSDVRRYVGVVRRVSPNRVWLEVAGPRVSRMLNHATETEITTAENINHIPVVDSAGFVPFFRDRVIALVLFDLLAISLFAW